MFENLHRKHRVERSRIERNAAVGRDSDIPAVVDVRTGVADAPAFECSAVGHIAAAKIDDSRTARAVRSDVFMDELCERS